jgi:DNA modification methylase
VDRWLNQIICGDNVAVMRQMPDRCIDLTVTSPPYDNLRTYNWFVFDFEGIAKELYRITKDGGVVVWVVGDATINGSKTGTSFRQALYFKEIGFNLHDTMIYAKNNPMPVNANRYYPCFEYMFVFSKGKPKTFNPILEETATKGQKHHLKQRNTDGSFRKATGYGKPVKPTRPKYNIWFYNVGGGQAATDKIAYKHPAIFPEKLAEDHIISWSNPGDIVFDPFLGSGTTAKMAYLNGRNYCGIDISEEYCEIARRRVEQAQAQQCLFGNV